MSEIRSCIDNVHFDDEVMLKCREDIFNKLNVAKSSSVHTNTLKLDMIDLRSSYNQILTTNMKMKTRKALIER